MKRGTNTIVNPMRGSTPIQKVMRGSTLVWQRNPRIYAVASSVGSRIEFSDDLGLTWDTTIVNPEAAGTPQCISLSYDGQIIAIGSNAGQPVQSVDGGSSWVKITSPSIADSRYLNVSGDGSTIIIMQLNTNNNIISRDSGVSYAQLLPVPPSNRLRNMQIANDGAIIYGLRPGQSPFYWLSSNVWSTRDEGVIYQGMGVARDNSKMYLGTGGVTITVLDPPSGGMSGVQYTGTANQSIVCSGDGSHVLVADGNALGVWLSTTFGNLPVDITSRIAWVTTTAIILRNSTNVSQTGQYMVIGDQGCVHVSDDYGATWTKRNTLYSGSIYNAAITG